MSYLTILLSKLRLLQLHIPWVVQQQSIYIPTCKFSTKNRLVYLASLRERSKDSVISSSAHHTVNHWYSTLTSKMDHWLRKLNFKDSSLCMTVLLFLFHMNNSCDIFSSYRCDSARGVHRIWRGVWRCVLWPWNRCKLLGILAVLCFWTGHCCCIIRTRSRSSSYFGV